MSAHRSPHPAPEVPRDVRLGHARTEREELAGLREMVDSLGAQLDLLYAERDAERDADARELVALRVMTASLTEQLVECYALQEQQARLDGRAPADPEHCSVHVPGVEPAAGR
jgi:hypothetical protein